MAHQDALLGAAEGTLRAGIRLLPGMCTNVFPQIFHLGRTKWTVGAGKWFLPSVDAGMLLKVRRDGCFVVTEGTLVDLGGGRAGAPLLPCGITPHRTPTVSLRPHL